MPGPNEIALVPSVSAMPVLPTLRYSVASDTLATVRVAPANVCPSSLVAAVTVLNQSTLLGVNVGFVPVAVTVGAVAAAVTVI